jgi:hypothetical protein
MRDSLIKLLVSLAAIAAISAVLYSCAGLAPVDRSERPPTIAD